MASLQKVQDFDLERMKEFKKSMICGVCKNPPRPKDRISSGSCSNACHFYSPPKFLCERCKYCPLGWLVKKDKYECMSNEHYIYCAVSGSLEKRDEAILSSTAFSSLLALLFVEIASIMERL